VLKTSELRMKDVVNITDGRRLGLIGDVELDMEQGRVISLVILGSGRLLGFFGRDKDIVIEWSQVRRIGEDVILVDLPPVSPQSGSY